MDQGGREFPYSQFPKKLNLGCGYDIRSEYLNVDINEFHKPDLVGDVLNLSMLPSNYYEEILANDILEHLPREKTFPALAEWNRLLKMGGRLILRVPNLVGLLQLFCEREFANYEKHSTLIQCLFGTQHYPEDYHFTGFTRITLATSLIQAGFDWDTFQDYAEWLIIVEAKKVGEAKLVLDIGNFENRAFIRFVYKAYLNRDPDETGFAASLEVLRNGYSREDLVNEVIGSKEFASLHRLKKMRFLEKRRWRGYLRKIKGRSPVLQKIHEKYKAIRKSGKA